MARNLLTSLPQNHPGDPSDPTDHPDGLGFVGGQRLLRVARVVALYDDRTTKEGLHPLYNQVVAAANEVDGVVDELRHARVDQYYLAAGIVWIRRTLIQLSPMPMSGETIMLPAGRHRSAIVFIDSCFAATARCDYPLIIGMRGSEWVGKGHFDR